MLRALLVAARDAFLLQKKRVYRLGDIFGNEGFVRFITEHI